jgi:photosystem II stability/assembly factor-like uncharacterized protein
MFVIKDNLLYYMHFLVIIFLLPMLSNNCLGQWVKMNGPYGGNIKSFTVNGAYIYAGTDNNGVYISGDNGLSWSSVNNGLGEIPVYSLSTSGNQILACTEYGLFSSSTNGTNWTCLLPNQKVYSIAVSGSDLYAGTSNGLFKGINNGSTWTQINIGVPYLKIMALLKTGSSIIAGTSGFGIYRSIDNGLTWNSVNNGLHSLYITSLAISGNTIYAGTSTYGVFQSSLTANSWQEINDGLTTMNIYALSIKGQNIFAGSAQGVFSCDISGKTWKNRFKSSAIPGLYTTGNLIIAGSSGVGAYISVDNGTTWTQSGLQDLAINKIAKLGSQIITRTSGGLFISNDIGLNWSSIDFGLPVYLSDFVVLGTKIIVSLPDGFYSSPDTGKTWNKIWDNTSFLQICVMNSSGARLYAGTNDGQILMSLDEGITWTPFTDNSNGYRILTMEPYGSGLLVGTTYSAYFISDPTANWIPINDGLTIFLPNPAITSFLITDSTIFASTYGKGVFKTNTNGNYYWESISNGFSSTTVNQVDRSGSNLYAAVSSNANGSLYGGVFILHDNSSTWLRKSEGLPNPALVTTMSFVENYILAGTKDHSIWRRDTSEIVSVAEITAVPEDWITIGQNIPNPFTGQTDIRYQLHNPGMVSLTVFNSDGIAIETLVHELQGPGSYSSKWDATGYSAGVYYYRLQVNNDCITKKLIVLN